MEIVRNADSAYGDAALAEFMALGALTSGRVAEATRAFDEAFAGWLELERFYSGERYRDMPLDRIIRGVDHSDSAIRALRSELPPEALSTDVLLEFHLCCTGFLGGRMATLLRDEGHHLRAAPVLPRRLCDFALKNVLVLVRVETTGLDADAAAELVSRNHNDFEIKAGAVLEGVDYSFIEGFRHIEEMSSTAVRALRDRHRNPAGELAALHDAARESFTSTRRRPLAQIASLAWAAISAVVHCGFTPRTRTPQPVKKP